MASAKKRRGRERKAARKKDNNDAKDHSNGGESTSIVIRTVDGVRRGGEGITSYAHSCVVNTTDIRIIDGLIKEGLLDVILGLLGRCNASFDSVMRDIGGDLQTPISWLQLLITIATKSNEYHSQIIDNIGPLVRCMCDDVERKFFGSKKYWHEAILPFIGIITNMLEFECNFIQLSQYKGLFDVIVQSWFWESNRNDIVNEFNTFLSKPGITVTITLKNLENKSATMTALGGMATFRLIKVARVTDDAKNMLRDIGSVPVVSRRFDPNCKISLVGGLIRYIKLSGDRSRNATLTALIQYADCVDKDVISEMIDYGYNFTSEFEDAVAATRLLCSMIMRNTDDGSKELSDSRTAFAIRAGLLGMCTSMIARFGGDENARGILASVSFILENIYFLLYHKKTSKAIGDKRGHLIEKVQHLKENKQVTNNECKQALCMIQSILDITSTNCYFCNKETERKDMKKCAACKSVCYCSEECQRKDWQSTHDRECEIIIVGMYLHCPICSNEREAAKLKGLERNIRMARKRLYLENADTIRKQLAVKEPPHSAYIVYFDISQWPITVTVMKYNECLHSDTKKWFEEDMQSDDENIMCVYASPFFDGNPNEPGGQTLVVHNIFPREWLSSEA